MKRTDISHHSPFYLNHVKKEGAYNMYAQHYHDSYEIYFQAGGKRYLFHNNICHALTRGDVVLLSPFEIHYGQSMESDYYERYVINFSGDFLKSILSREELLSLLDSLHSCIVHLSPGALCLFSSLFELLLRQQTQSHTPGKTQAAALLLLLQTLSSEAALNVRMEPDILTAPVKNALAYLEQHYAESFSLEELASAAHLSKYHFSRIFREATGASPMQYVTNLRLSHAHSLLLHSDLRLEEIAIQTGFSTYLNLERAFKKNYHLTPSALRNQSSNN